MKKKTLFVSIFAIFCIVISLCSCKNGNAQTLSNQQVEFVESVTKEMTKSLALTDDQAKKVKAINTEYLPKLCPKAKCDAQNAKKGECKKEESCPESSCATKKSSCNDCKQCCGDSCDQQACGKGDKCCKNDSCGVEKNKHCTEGEHGTHGGHCAEKTDCATEVCSNGKANCGKDEKCADSKVCTKSEKGKKDCDKKEIISQYHKKLKEVLTPEQLEKFKQQNHHHPKKGECGEKHKPATPISC